MIRIVSTLITLVLLVAPATILYAQTSENEPSTQVQNDLTCDSFYSPNDVLFVATPSIEETLPGTEVTFAGEVTNNSARPIVDLNVFARIHVMTDTGAVTVDEFLVHEDAVLAPGQTMQEVFAWQVPERAPGGSYYVTMFGVAADYIYYGISPLVEAGPAGPNFTVTSENALVTFSKAESAINGELIGFTERPVVLEDGETIEASVTITNPTDSEVRLPLQWNLYAWDSFNDDNIRDTTTEVVTIPAGESMSFTQSYSEVREPVSVLVARTNHRGVSSAITLPVQQSESSVTRVTYAGINSFPIPAGASAEVFACVEVFAGEAQNTSVSLSLTDGMETVTEVPRPVTERGFLAVSERFVADRPLNNLELRIETTENGAQADEFVIQYNCADFGANSCIQNNENDPTELTLFEKILQNSLWFFGGVVVLLLLLALVWSVHRRHRDIPKINQMNY
jgi:hypothetical protein